MSGQTIRWISERAQRINTFDTEAALADVRRFGDMVGDATVVALGVSSRWTHELSTLAHRLVRVLVEHHGFRSLALEGDEAASIELDAYVVNGEGDPVALLANARSFWRTAEILDLITWIRTYNRRHPDDPVRVAHPAKDNVTTEWSTMDEVERGIAANTLQWQEEIGHKVVYWGGVAHTRTRDSTQPTTGGTLMREQLGSEYVSVGLTFHHGSERGGVPAPPADFAEATLGAAGVDAYFLDLRADAPERVHEWLHAPIRARLIGPHYDPELFLSDGALAEWFDIIAQVTATTPVRPLS